MKNFLPLILVLCLVGLSACEEKAEEVAETTEAVESMDGIESADNAEAPTEAVIAEPALVEDDTPEEAVEEVAAVEEEAVEEEESVAADATEEMTPPTLPCDFDSYPADKQDYTAAEEIDLESHAGSAQFAAALSDGFEEEANAAGKYLVITSSCGEACQLNWIVDKETGKIIDTISTTAGLEFEADSNLLIVTEDEKFGYEKACYLLLDNSLIKLTNTNNSDKE